ncbi:hypothetical protein [Anaerocolumna sp. MB42-C2]|uniref:hypothetical protein n=1 Tax=Anaerocolumna sp. MB42-C2 TaxID=3070997 RepID=UPI0027E1CE31|nr:hypothetical protein [Anaerocolumna sp. MB42-C2]WMJ90207.1 hypothetical protein RBU59_11970 [Anaerocolumna sp. MB42-C2]
MENNKKRSNFIYDDSPDLHRVIAMSDAYYGDASSVMTLYQKTGKPIIYQYHDFVNPLSLLSGVIDGDVLYTTFLTNSLLAKVNLKSGEVETIAIADDSDVLANNPRMLSTLLKDEIFLIPTRTKNLIRYNVKNSSKKEYWINENYSVNLNRSAYLDGKLYLIPFFYPAIGVLDLQKDELRFINIPNFVANSTYVRSSCLAGNKIMLVTLNPNCVIEFDCNTESLRTVDKASEYMSICYDGRNCWLGCLDTSLVKWDLVTGAKTKYLNFPKGFKSSETLKLYVAIYLNGFAIFQSLRSNMFLRVNTQTSEIDALNLPPEESTFDPNITDGCYYLTDDGVFVYLFSRRKTAIIKVDVAKNEYEVIKLKYPEDLLNSFSKQPTDKPFGEYADYEAGRFQYDFVYDIPYLVDHLPYTFSERNISSGTAGKAIYDFVKKQVLGN